MCRVKPYYTHTHTCWCVRRPRCQMSINMQSRRPTASLHGINAALPLLPPRSTIPPTRRTNPVPMPRPHTRVHKYTSRTDYPYTLFLFECCTRADFWVVDDRLRRAHTSNSSSVRQSDSLSLLGWSLLRCAPCEQLKRKTARRLVRQGNKH